MLQNLSGSVEDNKLEMHMKKIKKWLQERYLPATLRQDLLSQVQECRNTITALKAENAALNAYIDGMERAIRLCGRRIRGKDDKNGVQ